MTDWRTYDTIYTERYMGLAPGRPARIRYRSLYRIPRFRNALEEGLSRSLMILHNYEDDNVLFQNSLRHDRRFGA